MTNAEHATGVNELAERFWEAILELSPTTATMYGDDRYDDRLDDPGPDGRARMRSLFTRTLTEAEGLVSLAGGVEDQITLDMLRVVCELGIEQDDQRIDRLRVVDQISGPQTLLAQVAQFQRTETPEQVERLIARLHAYPAFMAANTELVREGLATGLTAARIVTERTVAQLHRLLEVPPDQSPLATTVKVSDADRERIAAIVRDEIYPADAAFLDAISGEYLAKSRTEPGLWSAPHGDSLYQTQIRSWTTLQVPAEELHRIGLEELESIEAERRTIAGSHGFGDDTAGYRAHLMSEQANIPASELELLARANEDIRRALDASPAYFGRLPEADVEVRPVEAFKQRDAPFAYYYPPTTDGRRPGIYWVNTYDLPSRTYHRLASTTYHEAVPGHHFQIAIEMELDTLNTFRRLGSRMVGMAFPEGWGLYSERLADEMGLYRTDAERFGMLDAQAWRAARLVTDTGMHALRWSRERSIEALRSAGLPDTDATIETDRYIVWPGQALTYKVGQREIERLRSELSSALGSAFDLRRFHDEILGHGSLPLATLARELPRWLAAPVA